MKREQQPERFYYNITIEHDPAHIDERHFMKSKAEKTIEMETPLMEDPGDYNMSVCKFSINTEAIPVFIPEINEKQYDVYSNKVYTNLKIGYFNRINYKNKNGDWLINNGKIYERWFYYCINNHPNGFKKIKPYDTTK